MTYFSAVASVIVSTWDGLYLGAKCFGE
jgi:hypothetical protein